MRPHDHTRGRAVCRAALRRGDLTKSNLGWRFGCRRFAWVIVRELLDSGEAIQIGDRIISARAA